VTPYLYCTGLAVVQLTMMGPHTNINALTYADRFTLHDAHWSRSNIFLPHFINLNVKCACLHVSMCVCESDCDITG